MEELIIALLSQDNVLRNKAEVYYKNLKQSNLRETIISLLTLLKDNNIHDSHKILCCVLLRGIATRESTILTTILNQDDIIYIRKILLESLSNETSYPIQRKISSTIASFAKNVYNDWPELIQMIINLSKSSIVNHQILCLYLLDQLAEHNEALFINNFSTIISIICPMLESRIDINGNKIDSQQDELGIRVSASQAFCSLLFTMTDIDTSITIYLNSIYNVLTTSLSYNDELSSQDILTSLIRLSKEQPTMFINSYIKLFEICTTILNTKDIDNLTKVMSLQLFINLIINTKSSIFCSNIDTRTNILNLCMNIIRDLDSDNDDDNIMSSTTRPNIDQGMGDTNDDDSDDNLPLLASNCLDILSKSFIPNEIIQICLQSSWNLVNQDNWKSRRAALFIVRIIYISPFSNSIFISISYF
jgi:hypothetical protein